MLKRTDKDVKPLVMQCVARLGSTMARRKRSDDVIIRIPREHFAKIGRKGGLVGGKKTAANMTPEERHARAVKAAKKRWKGHRKKE